jgi:hypothetical protein
MNHSIYSADRATHLKIVVVGLACATLVAGVAVAARATSVATETTLARLPAGTPHGKASRQVTATIQASGPTIR